MFIPTPLQAVTALSYFVVLAGVGLAQTTERVSLSSAGAQGNGNNGFYASSISADGRYVVFESIADNLVPADTNSAWDIFVHDSLTGVTDRVSVDSLGAQGNSASFGTSISADGRFVAFQSNASNLVAADTNGVGDIFVHDRQTGLTQRISVNSLGVDANAGSYRPSLCANGRYVAFQSYANNLVPADTNGVWDIFIHDRQTRSTQRLSVDSLGVQGNDSCFYPSISTDGNEVAFYSYASNLVPGDSNGSTDVFVHNRQTGLTQRVSVDSIGIQGNGHSYHPSISGDGRYVAFVSAANDLVPGDTNARDDIFVRDRQKNVTERVSVGTLGMQGSGFHPSMSANGRYVAFDSGARKLIPGDTNALDDVFVHDRQSKVTERVSVDSFGTQGNNHSYYPTISADGRYVAFDSGSSNLVTGDTNGTDDIFVHDRWNGLGANSIYLTGPSTAPVLASVDFSWQATRGNSDYWLAYSQNWNGAVIGGHIFDLGDPKVVIATGTNSTNGLGDFNSAPVPASAAGLTLYFEVAARDADGVLYDSNVLAVTFY